MQKIVDVVFGIFFELLLVYQLIELGLIVAFCFVNKEMNQNSSIDKSYSKYNDNGVSIINWITDCVIHIPFVLFIGIFIFCCASYMIPKDLALNIATIEGIMVTICSVVESMLIFFLSYKRKDYYLYVQKINIQENKYINVCSKIHIVFTFCSIPIMFLVLHYAGNNDCWNIIYMMCAITSFTLGGYILLKLLAIVSVNNRTKKKALVNLYKIFWDKSNLEINEISKEIIDDSIECLLNDYVYSKEIKKLSKLNNWFYTDFEKYCSQLSINCGNIMFAIEIVILVVSFDLAYFINMKYFYILFAMGILVLMLFSNKRIYDTAMYFFSKIIYDYHGYIFEYNGKNQIFVGNICIDFGRFGRERKYVNAIKNIMAVFYIATLNMDETVEYISNSLQDIYCFLKKKEATKNNYEKALYYLPVFVCGFLVNLRLEIDEKSKTMQLLKNLYEEFKLTDIEKEKYLNTMVSILYEIASIRNIMKIGLEDKSLSKQLAENSYWKKIML